MVCERIDIFCKNCGKKLADCDPEYLSHIVSFYCIDCGDYNHFLGFKIQKRQLTEEEKKSKIKFEMERYHNPYLRY